jgi:hypothetical protein
VDGDKLRRTTATIRKRKKIRRMSKDLNAKIDEPHMFRAFEKEWPLSNNDEKAARASRCSGPLFQ